MKQIAERLKAHEIKVTPQRIAVYDYLCNVKTHPSAETIYKALDPEYPTISLATIYKTLNALKSSHLVQELNVGNGTSLYDACVENHYHFICNECGSISDVDDENALSGIQNEVSGNTGFEITAVQLYLFGRCNNCKK